VAGTARTTQVRARQRARTRLADTLAAQREREKANEERRTLSAHRFALLLAAGTLDHHTFGEHHCNETLCVRVAPTHLHPGTQSANLRYAVSLGRHRGCLPTNIDPRGRHGRAHAIRAALTGGYDPLRLAAARTYSPTPTLPLFDLNTR